MPDDEETVETQCPRCGEWVEDMDGFGVLAHIPGCGYCSHPDRYGGVCGICGDKEAVWVTSTTFFRVEAVLQSSGDVASEWFNRVGRPGDTLEAQEDVTLMGMLLIVRHRLPI